MKRLFCILLVVMLLVSCSNPATLKLGILKGPTGMGLVHLLDQNEWVEEEILGTPDEMVAKLVSGELDMGSVPLNVASILYHKTKGEIVLLANNALGSLGILERGETVHSLEDLQGKTLYVSGKNASPQYVIEYLLQQHKIDAEIIYESDHTLLATKMAAGEVDLCMLPEPFISLVLLKNPEVRYTLDINQPWHDTSGMELTMGALVGRKSVMMERRSEVQRFLKEGEKSVEWVLGHPEEASVRMVHYGLLPDADIAKRSIEHAGISFSTAATKKKDMLHFLEILYQSNPKSIGGALPGEDFFYQP